MGGLLGAVYSNNYVNDLFYGRDYHSHLGTQHGGHQFKLKIGEHKFLIILLFVINLFISTTPNCIGQDNFSENSIGSSCTIFTIALGDTVMFGNNEDYKSNNAYQWYIPTQNIATRNGYQEIYGYIFFGFDNNGDEGVDTWPQGGMNEYGLCFDANGLPNAALHLDVSKSYPYSDYALSQVLWECRNVEEVIDWYQNHRWSSLAGQIHYADKSGDAVVVGVNTTTGKWAFTRKNLTYFVSTNFNLDNPESGHFPCSRYTTATQMLSEIINETDLNMSACASILYEVHQEGKYATKYSNIFDPVNLDIYFNYGKEFTLYKKINLLEKLAEKESFEEEEKFFGITGTDGYVLVNTEKIDILSWSTNNNIAHIVFPIILGVIGVIAIPIIVILLKRRKKRN
ncbi:MAG: carcinine hydrolase/isopenicillin-N N-acyltransferase family protein [Promethearchaeota archaeon]